MAAIPQGAFAACKVRRNLERNAMITPPIEEREKVGKENTYNMRPPSEGTYQIHEVSIIYYILGCYENNELNNEFRMLLE